MHIILYAYNICGKLVCIIYICIIYLHMSPVQTVHSSPDHMAQVQEAYGCVQIPLDVYRSHWLC
jgi:hypothetical protein